MESIDTILSRAYSRKELKSVFFALMIIASSASDNTGIP